MNISSSDFQFRSSLLAKHFTTEVTLWTSGVENMVECMHLGKGGGDLIRVLHLDRGAWHSQP